MHQDMLLATDMLGMEVLAMLGMLVGMPLGMDIQDLAMPVMLLPMLLATA